MCAHSQPYPALKLLARMLSWVPQHALTLCSMHVHYALSCGVFGQISGYQITSGRLKSRRASIRQENRTSSVEIGPNTFKLFLDFSKTFCFLALHNLKPAIIVRNSRLHPPGDGQYKCANKFWVRQIIS